MVDVLTPEQRHNAMAAVKSKNTKPEILVRRYLWSHGFRYRTNYPGLPGKPDIVLRRYKTCIFVNGCFWHGHDNCRLFVMPKSRIDYWQTKIRRNRARDAEVEKKLLRMGWNCITIWECQLLPSKREKTLADLTYVLDTINSHNHRVVEYKRSEEEDLMAAEQDYCYGDYYN